MRPPTEAITALGPWFHNLHLPGGVQTAPHHHFGDFPRFKWQAIAPHMPDDLSGKRVLDIGCNAGFYSFALAERGASVLGLYIDEHYLEQARWAAKITGLSGRTEFRKGTVYDVERLGEDFDIVVFMGGVLPPALSDAGAGLRRLSGPSADAVPVAQLRQPGCGGGYRWCSVPRPAEAGGARLTEARLYRDRVFRRPHQLVDPEPRCRTCDAGGRGLPRHGKGLDGFGFAMATGEDRILAVQTFSGSGTPRDPEGGDGAPVLAPAQVRDRLLAAINDARETAGVSALVGSVALDTVARALLPEDRRAKRQCGSRTTSTRCSQKAPVPTGACSARRLCSAAGAGRR